MELLRAYFLANRDEIIFIRPFNPFALVFLLLPLFFLRRRGKSAGYLLCFSLFFLYLWAVVAYVICPLPIGSDLVDYMRRIDKWSERVNLIPTFFDDNFYFDDPNVTDNFLLGVPFGLGLPFVVSAKNRVAKRAVGIVFGFAAGLELIQLAISAVFYGFPYRSIDIDDVLFVFAGTLLGYGVFRAGAYVYRRLGWARGARWPVWDHFHAVLGGPDAAEPSKAPPDEEQRKEPSSPEAPEPVAGRG